ncbi:MAG: hypothetical protein ACRD8O_24135 [Bryobacteraceae bacterium]
MELTILLIQLAGVLHLIIASANFLLPKKLHYGENLAKLSPVVRQVFVVHSVYIVLVIVFFGCVALRFAPEMARGQGIFAWLSGFLAFFWLLRFPIQFFYFDPEIKRRHWVANFFMSAAVLTAGAIYAAAAFGRLR